MKFVGCKHKAARLCGFNRVVTPHWYDIAAKANRGDIKASAWLEAQNIHASEDSWAGTEFNQIVDNNGSIEHLYNQLKNLV